MEAPLNGHLTPAELQAALRAELSRVRWQQVVRHLLRGCEECRTLLASGLRPTASSPEREADYDHALDVSFARILQTGYLLKQREKRASPGKGTKARSAKPLEGVALVESLLERSWISRYDDPREMVRLAHKAVEVALGLDPAVEGARRAADWQARAWGELANAQRVANDLWDAQHSFGEAFKLLERGTGDRLLKVRLHDFHASLLGTQRKFAFALEALDVVYHLYQEIGDVHLAGRSLITKAIYMHYSGRSEEAIALNERGLTLIDEQRDPGLPTLAIQNQLWFLVAGGRFHEAQDLLSKHRERSGACGQVMAIKSRWLEGQIDYGLGDLAAAEAAFLEVKRGFESVGLGFAEALAALDLALVWMQQGRAFEAEKVVVEAAGVFAALEVHREVLAAVQLLREAFRIRKASVELIAKTVAFLRDYWQINPDLQTRFI
jgi:tetratricopeptide (TPR) repeat protein